MTTLVTPREVIDLAFADGGYLPPEAIGTVDIAAAEARYLLPVTGPALWQKLAEGEYPTLREEFAAPAAACAVRVAMQPALDLHGGAGGTTVTKSSACQPAGQQQLAASHRALRNRLSALLHALSDHLDAHPSDYPEYAPEKNVLHRVLIAGGLVLTPAAARRSPPPRTATPAESGIPAKQGAVFCFPGINAYLWPRKRLGGPPVERRTE